MTKLECKDPRFESKLYAYELGMLSDEQRSELELHLLDCPSCMEKSLKFEPVARLLRHDADVRSELEQLAAIDEPATERAEVGHGKKSQLRRFVRVSFVAAAAIVVLLLKPWQLEFKPDQPVQAAMERLLILPFENISADQPDSRLGEAVASLLITDLSGSRFVSVVSSQQVDDIRHWQEINSCDKNQNEILGELVKRAGARWLLSGKIISDQQSLVLVSELTEYPSGKLIAGQRVTQPSEEEIFSLIDLLTVEVKSDLALPVAAFEETDRPVAEVTTHSQEAYLCYLEGVDYIAKMYTREATDVLELCLTHDSTFAMAYYLLAETKDRSLIDQAVRYGQQASHKEQLYIQSRAASYSADYPQAIETLNELIERYPAEKQALFLLGSLEYNLKNYASAASYFDQVLQIDPLHKASLNVLSYTYDAMGEFDGAIGAINRYIVLAPNEANPYDTRGDIYCNNGRLDLAIESYLKALEKKPDFFASVSKLGHVYLLQQNLKEAEEMYGQVLSQGSAGERISARLYLTYVPVRRGNLDEALGALSDAFDQCKAETDTEYTSFIYLTSLIYMEQENYEQALISINRALTINQKDDPDNHSAYSYTVARCLTALGEQNSADSVIELIRDYYDRVPNPPTGLYRAKGLSAIERGDAFEAIDNFEKLVDGYRLSQGFSDYYYLGEACLLGKKYEKAAEILSGLLDIYSSSRAFETIKSVKIHYLLGQAYEGLGENELSIEQYRIFLRLWGDSDQGLRSVADAKERLARLENRS